MKRFILIVSVIVVLIIFYDMAYYRMGWYIDIKPNKEVTTFVKTDEDTIYLDRGNGFEAFEIKGVNMGSGEPGEWSTDFGIDKDTYMRWFKQIKEMGANTIRIYTVQQDTFYKAFYEYNKDNPDPLYLIHGVWVNDYIQNSHRDAYDEEFFAEFAENCKIMIDVIHGNKKIALGRMTAAGHGSYTKDISPWVIGYILGVEWEDVTVAFTDDNYKGVADYCEYVGEYMYTKPDATPFEAMLARVGDMAIEYESKRYKEQRIVAFSNWPTTDPFDYPETVKNFFMKCAKVDVEHIGTTMDFLSGQFASYHIYPYYPDYLDYVEDWSDFGINDASEFITEEGELNTYKAYLSVIMDHHTMPVVISEFGVSTGRGMAQRDRNTGRNQGHMSENGQGEAIVECYEDIISEGAAGCCVFTWQDEWFKRTWNTMYAVNLNRTPYWSDYQTNEQYFGLLSFDPGKEESICYVNGDFSDWNEEDKVFENKTGSLSMKYDERFIYFLVHKDGLDFENDTIYIPIDLTPESGSTFCKNYELLFERAVDFVIVINGKDNSRLKVQERYEALRSTYSENVYGFDTYIKENIPDVDSPEFVDVDMILQTATALIYGENDTPAEVFETGKLLYGNADPESPLFDSLADFINNGEYIELKLPWQILNFSDPSVMNIHDDYYDGNYGVEYTTVDEMYVSLADGSESGRVAFYPFALEGWGNEVTYHERLKSSYHTLKERWGEDE